MEYGWSTPGVGMQYEWNYQKIMKKCFLGTYSGTNDQNICYEDLPVSKGLKCT